MPVYTHTQTSGQLKLSVASLAAIGITLAPGDTLNIQAGTYGGLSATGLNGSAGNPITIHFNTGANFQTDAYTGDKDVADCSFLVFDGINVLHYTNATFSTMYGATHDIEYKNCTFKEFTDQIAFEIGTLSFPKTYNGTKASCYYNIKFTNCVFDGTRYGPFIEVKNGICLDFEADGCTFTNVRQPDSAQYPYPIYIFGFGAKIHDCVFSHIAIGGHVAMILIYGYGDVYNNLFSDEWGNDVRCFPMALNMTGYNLAVAKNRYWNNISINKRKHSIFEFNTNNTNAFVNDGSGNYLNLVNNFVYFNTAYNTKYTESVQAFMVDFYGAVGTVKNNLYIRPESNITYQSTGRNYMVMLDNGFAYFGPASAVEGGNVTRGTLNPADWDENTFAPVLGGTLVDNTTEDISFITTDFYGNPRKSGANSDAGAVELQQSTGTPPTAIAGANDNITLPTSTVALDGTGSTDPDGTIVSYKWTQTLGPAGATILNPNIKTTSVSGLVAGNYTFVIEVTDNDGNKSYAGKTVVVNAAPPPPVINIFAGRNGVVAKNTGLFSDIGVNSANTVVIFELRPTLRSFVPGRGINGINGFIAEKAYYWIANTDMDQTANFIPPIN